LNIGGMAPGDYLKEEE